MCTRTLWLPVLDLAATVVVVSIFGVGVIEDDSVITAAGAGSTALLATSTAYGFLTVDGCESDSD